MALFAKNDSDLPLLTQVYQLDASDPREIAQFAGWLHTGAAEAFRLHFIDLDEAKPTDDAWSISKRAEVVKDAQAVVTLAQNIMRSLFYAASVRHSDLWILGEQVARGRHSYAIKPGAWPEGDAAKKIADDALVPVKAIVPTVGLGHYLDGNYEYDLHLDIAMSLDRLLKDYMAGRAKLGLCSECKNVFVQSRVDQVFCSHRCASRISARRRRNQRKPVTSTIPA